MTTNTRQGAWTVPHVALVAMLHGQTFADLKASHRRNKREPVEAAWHEHVYTELCWARWRVDEAGAYCEVLASSGEFAYHVRRAADGTLTCNCLAHGKCRHIHHALIVAKYPESKPWILPERSLIELARAA